jgi:2-(1,2-epoxy-1,2-dihydrophenyl)acetyl-CoA isomerase
MSADPAPLLFAREGAVAKLTLNRPQAGNAIDVPLAKALREAAIQCDEDDAIRCVILTGAGKFFCAGGDVGGFAAVGYQVPALLKELTFHLHTAVLRFARMRKPLVTVVNGAAAGAGFSLAILGDIALAAQSAPFTLAYTAIGLSPDGGASWLLPRLVGMRRAQELALTNKRLSATEAVEIGLVTRAVADDALAAEADAVAAQLANAATRALGRTRNLLDASFSNGLEEHLEAEARSIIESGGDAEGREGIAAFLAKRKPNFRP